MDKKVGVSILFGFLLLVGFIGLTIATNDSGASTNMLGQVNITLDGDGYSNESWTRGGDDETANVTIRYGLTSGLMNITNITITLDANFTFQGWVEFNDDFAEACFGDPRTEAAANCQGANVTYTNVTLMNGNPGLWSCLNTSATVLNCYNTSAEENTDLGPDNSTITIRFRVKATDGFEDRADWVINATYEPDQGAGDSNTSTVYTYIDGLGPRITDINITDGNTTFINGSLADVEKFVINESSKFSTASNLFIFATVIDLMENLSGAGGPTLQLVYNESVDYMADGNLTSLNDNGSSALVNASAAIADGTLVNSWSIVDGDTYKYSLGALVKWQIPRTVLIDGNNTQFMFLLNDSYDQGTAGTDNGTTDAFHFEVNDSNYVTIGNVNITDGVNTVKAVVENTTYLKAGNLTVAFELDGRGANRVTLIYNETGSFGQVNGDLSLGATFINAEINMTSAANISANQELGENHTYQPTVNFSESEAADPATELWKTSFELNVDNSSNVLTFAIFVNASDSGDDETDVTDYVVHGGPYYVTIDGVPPSVSLNTPATSGIDTSESIEYICTANDGLSGVAKYAWYLKKPASDFTLISEVNSVSSTNTKKFSGSDISTPGTHSVRCRVTDNVGNVKDADTTPGNDFTVTISSSVVGGGAGGGGAGAAISFDVDFTTSPQATFKASQGRVKSFSFDGVTKHTITFNEVTANSVTLMIASDPITVLLNTGQSKSIDVNVDGTDDMKVQLNGVDNGVADVTVTKLEEGAAKIKAEEEQTRGATETGEGKEVTPVRGRSLAWLWWTLIVIVAIVAIGYYVNKRK